MVAIILGVSTAGCAGGSAARTDPPSSRAAGSLAADQRCGSASSCWMPFPHTAELPSRADQTLGLVLHWDGSRWSLGHVPDPMGASPRTVVYVDDVSCPSGSDCWAVGFNSGRGASTAQDTWHWDGTRWSYVATPALAGAQDTLTGVSCVSASDCWAVGEAGSGLPFAWELEHWDGRRWSLAPAPQTGSAGETRIACVSSADCWAVGDEREALHWDGSRWSGAPTPKLPGGITYGVSCASSSDCWAVGVSESDDQPETSTTGSWAMHWDGSAWALAKIPHPDGTAHNSDNELYGVTCTKQACWTVGWSLGSGHDGVILKWQGSKWTRVAAPQPGVRGSLSEVACTSPSSCWALGGSGRRDTLDELYWNGTKWARFS